MTKSNFQFYETVIVPMYKQIYFYILSAVSDHDIAADLTQEVFETAFRKLYQLRDRKKVKNWILSIAANKVRKHYLKEKQTWLLVPEEEMQNSEDSFSGLYRDISCFLVQEEQKQNLEKAFRHLDPQSRKILSLNLFMEIPLKQIAEDMDLNYSTLRSWKYRSLKRLRTELEKMEGGKDDEL